MFFMPGTAEQGCNHRAARAPANAEQAIALLGMSLAPRPVGAGGVVGPAVQRETDAGGDPLHEAPRETDMAYVEKSVDVDVAVSTAYNQWTQFEEFPAFMEGVKSVRQIDDKHLHWRAEVAGKTLEWHAEITDQTPETRIAWRSTSGVHNGGAVLFEPLGPQRTRVTVRIDYEPDGVSESVGSALGLAGGKVEDDLERFKAFIESRGRETGAWRGEIHGKQVKPQLS
jgi:uncharacterized membrane protein